MYIDVGIIILGASVDNFNGSAFAQIVAEVLDLPYTWVQVINAQAVTSPASQRRMTLRRLHARVILQQTNTTGVNATTRVYSDHLYDASGSSPSTIGVLQSVVNNGTLTQSLDAVYPTWNVTQVSIPVNQSITPSSSSPSSGAMAGAIAGATVGFVVLAGAFMYSGLATC